MVRISSGSTFLFKRFYPLLLPVLILCMIFISGIPTTKNISGFLIDFAPVILATGVYLIMRRSMKKKISEISDEVWDEENSLLVKNKGMEEHVLLSDIVNVNYLANQWPPRITLLLRSAGIFGKEISFI